MFGYAQLLDYNSCQMEGRVSRTDCSMLYYYCVVTNNIYIQ